jgi:hypothetical protein
MRAAPANTFLGLGFKDLDGRAAGQVAPRHRTRREAKLSWRRSHPDDEYGFAGEGRLGRRASAAREVHAQVAMRMLVAAIAKPVCRIHGRAGHQRYGGDQYEQAIAGQGGAQGAHDPFDRLGSLARLRSHGNRRRAAFQTRVARGPFDAHSGKILLKQNVVRPSGGGVVSYAASGKQHVAAVSVHRLRPAVLARTSAHVWNHCGHALLESRQLYMGPPALTWLYYRSGLNRVSGQPVCGHFHETVCLGRGPRSANSGASAAQLQPTPMRSLRRSSWSKLAWSRLDQCQATEATRDRDFGRIVRWRSGP